MTDRTSTNSPGPNTGPGDTGQAPSAKKAENSALLHVLLNIAMVAVFVFLFIAAGDLPDSQWEPLGAGSFPRAVLAVLILLNIITLVQSARPAMAEVRAHGHEFFRIIYNTLWEFRLVLFVLGAFGVFISLIGWLGFAISAFLYAFGLQIFLGPTTLKNVVIALVLSAAVSFGLEYFFASALNVFLPRGIVLG